MICNDVVARADLSPVIGTNGARKSMDSIVLKCSGSRTWLSCRTVQNLDGALDGYVVTLMNELLCWLSLSIPLGGFGLLA